MHERGYTALAGLGLSLLLALPQFWVGSRAGRIVVYRVDDPEPWYVSGPVVERLPRDDRLRLDRGFTVAGERALWAALEDYTG